MKYLIMTCLFLILIMLSCHTPDNRISIAILTPVTHPSLEQIEEGFKKTIESYYPNKYRFTTYNAQGNKTLMRSEIEEIINNHYSLVFTIGTSASQMTQKIFEKKGLTTPIVFTCVNDPIGFQIISSETNPGKNVTGVKELLCFEKELTLLLQYKPAIKHILLVYNPTEPGLQKDQQEIARILQQKNLVLQTVEVFQTNEIFAKVSPFMPTVDALVVLKDNTVISGLDVLVKQCDSYRIPLMASDLDSPDRGAAFGYGVNEVNFGIEGAHKALQILVHGLQPGSIPVTPVSDFNFRINHEAAKRQGVEIQ